MAVHGENPLALDTCRERRTAPLTYVGRERRLPARPTLARLSTNIPILDQHGGRPDTALAAVGGKFGANAAPLLTRSR